MHQMVNVVNVTFFFYPYPIQRNLLILLPEYNNPCRVRK